jgi:predicted PurR-regulated permease PerM
VAMISSNTTDAHAAASLQFRQRVLFVVKVFLALMLIGFALWFEIRVLLLGFTGLLLAVFLYVISDWFTHRLKLRHYWIALLLTCVLILGVLGSMIWLIEWRVSGQVDKLRASLPAAWARLQVGLDKHSWAGQIVDQARIELEDLPNQGLLGRGMGLLARTGKVFAEIFVVLFVGLFLAINPQLYVRGALRLVPLASRARAREVMTASGWLLWWWLVGQLVSMAFIGVVTGLVIWGLGVPLALTLGVIAALLNFIPNFGPILAVVPAGLLAVMQGPAAVLWVVIAYIAIQSVQNHVVTPLVQQQVVRLPPVILILSQLFMYYWAGLLGMALAPPLAALVILVVQKLYVRDALRDPMQRTQGWWPDEKPGNAATMPPKQGSDSNGP